MIFHLQAILANVIWGSMPLFFYALGEQSPFVILAIQIISTFLLTLAYFYMFNNMDSLSFNKFKESAGPSLFLMLNWSGYAVAVNSGFVIEASYAYLILPVLMLAVGELITKSKDVVGFFSLIVCALIVGLNSLINHMFPWIGFGIALPFVGYILWHSKRTLSPIEGVFYETLWMFPLGVALLVITSSPGNKPLLDFFYIHLGFIGVLTILPLTLFIRASKKVSFDLLSIYQLISPILGMLIGFALYRQNVSVSTSISYAGLVVVLFINNYIKYLRGKQ